MVFKVMFISLIGNAFLSVFKILGGILGNSKTLVADGIHSFSDLATDIVAIIGNKFATLPPDKDHPYGHGKYEYVFSSFISLIIIFLSFVIFYNSFNGTSVVPSKFVLVVLLISFIVKFYLAKFILKNGKKYNNRILITSGIESKYDALNSLLGCTFVFLSLFSSNYPILKCFDSLGSLVISVLVFNIGIKCLIQNLKSVIGEVDYSNNYINDIIYKISVINRNIEVKSVKLFKYGSYYNAEIKLSCKKNKRLKQIYKLEEKIRKAIMADGICKFMNIDFVPSQKM